ncbi:MAG: hypothetical protein AAF940_05745 [Pseudomonadota bacterium]
MRKPGTYTGLEDLGRVRLSKHFYMRNFLHSEIANFYGRSNIPDDPKLAIAAGTQLATHILDPLVDTFGPIEIRSGFRSCDLNHFGATEVTPQKCSANPKNYAGHIWDRRDESGSMGATVSIVVPWFADQYNKGRDWRDLAWWIYDHLPQAETCFFPKNAGFNIQWHESDPKLIYSYMGPRGYLLRPGDEPNEDADTRGARYADFPPLGGIIYPDISKAWAE